MSNKDLRNIIQQLRTISNEKTENTDHNEFLRFYAKNVRKIFQETKTLFYLDLSYSRIQLLEKNVKRHQNQDLVYSLNYGFY